MLLPDICAVSGSEFFVCQQDSAPSHRAKDTVALLDQETPDFIPTALWPPNSPDLNPVDYTVWSVLQERVYRTKMSDVDELKRRINNEWAALSHFPWIDFRQTFHEHVSRPRHMVSYSRKVSINKCYRAK